MKALNAIIIIACALAAHECYRIAERALNGLDWSDRDELLNNISYVARQAKRFPMVFACWGAIARDDALIEQLVEEMQTGAMPYPDIWCWGKTGGGAPTHPMARGKHRIDPLVWPIKWRSANIDEVEL
jgi:hypothetical protein